MIFVAPGTEGAVVHNLAARLAPGGVLVCGFQLTGRLALDEYDAMAAAAGLVPRRARRDVERRAVRGRRLRRDRRPTSA